MSDRLGMMRWALFIPSLVIVSAFSLPSAGAAACVGPAFSIDAYFRVRTIDELALSQDGHWLAYADEPLNGAPAEGVRGRIVQLQRLEGRGSARALPRLSAAHDLVWIPRHHELGFLMEQEGVIQVFGYDIEAARLRQITLSHDDVVSFRFAPDGITLAYVTIARNDSGPSLFDRLARGTKGVLIDSDTAEVDSFLDPAYQSPFKQPSRTLWVETPGHAPEDVAIPGEPPFVSGGYFWSSDARRLSVTFSADHAPTPTLIKQQWTSVGVFDLADRRFRVVAQARLGDPGHAPVSFAGGEWLPRRDVLLIRRSTLNDPWVSPGFSHFMFVDATNSLAGGGREWPEIEVLAGDRIWPVDAGKALVETTVAAERSLYVATPAGMGQSPLLSGLEGSSSQFEFGGHGQVVAFVNQSLTRPPEIYVSMDGKSPRQITHLNDVVTRNITYQARAVSWKGADGVKVAGWLLEPPAGMRRPWPMITMVHGGPGFAITNIFAPYFRVWPYPFEVLADKGFAIFFPNYRGTLTYGRAYASSKGSNPQTDIIAGVRSLVTSGVADFKRLGIAGQSHGAWLGPLVMAKAKMFKAASFAEGWSNDVVSYELMSGDLNRKVNDWFAGCSLYECPSKYVSQSPDLMFEGLRTAALFEAGAFSGPIDMMGYPKAAHRAGMPTEFIVYPKTRHNATIPAIQEESAERNLAWFQFWLESSEDACVAKAAWLNRWRKLQKAQTGAEISLEAN